VCAKHRQWKYRKPPLDCPLQGDNLAVLTILNRRPIRACNTLEVDSRGHRERCWIGLQSNHSLHQYAPCGCDYELVELWCCNLADARKEIRLGVVPATIIRMCRHSHPPVQDTRGCFEIGKHRQPQWRQ